jgi:hypothetical protein
MAKNIILFSLVFLLSSFTDRAVLRSCVINAITKEVGVKEKTGNNDGKRVEFYLHSVGLTKGASWCAAFVHCWLTHCGVANTITAWSPTAHNPNNICYFKGKTVKTPEPADVFTLYSITKRRIHHTGFFVRKINSHIYETIEGNTNNDGSANGDGVYRRKRSFHQTYSITSWIN